MPGTNKVCVGDERGFVYNCTFNEETGQITNGGGQGFLGKSVLDVAWCHTSNDASLKTIAVGDGATTYAACKNRSGIS
jgi:WD40 repeat protein